MRLTFRVLNERDNTERVIENLCQKGSAIVYSRDFQRYMIWIEWGNTALSTVYYRDLKDSIKDKLSRISKPDNFSEMIIKAYKIDNYFYFRSQERKGKYGTYRRIDIVKYLKSSNWSDPMKLDTTTKYLISQEK